ncbi:hypothetical protein MARCHEWKA_02120 [Brevundimonas phage vB_BpoS-Marchewka]|uniref:Uncharacterized protein n=1 Tax=Brevundimonas phage vB_BpoS-Marchewka TaxID=2948604 RepID=A0A9E7N5I0_9CAUD|nr:hypothetical protein MARCHEWKA_02120 [Brevundimonas phage vB_BpoS-Marchewka]
MSESYMNDLLRVGRDKPMGYLPLGTIVMAGWTLERALAWLQTTDLQHRVFTQAESNVFGGALYVWDERAVQRLLDLNQTIVQDNGWGWTAELFVMDVVEDFAADPDLYALVGVMFADERFVDTPLVRRA